MTDADTAQRVPAPRITEPGVIVIDAQPWFIDRMAGRAYPLVLRLEKLLTMAGCLKLPTLATFEDPARNGWLPQDCEAAWPTHGVRLEKHSYDCCGHPEILEAIRTLDREQLLLAGGETDVCLLESVLSLLDHGFQVFLLEDCVFSTEPHVGPALRRMEAAGAVPCTVKTAYYELMRSVLVLDDPATGGPGWPELLPRFGQPETWPEWDRGR